MSRPAAGRQPRWVDPHSDLRPRFRQRRRGFWRGRSLVPDVAQVKGHRLARGSQHPAESSLDARQVQARQAERIKLPGFRQRHPVQLAGGAIRVGLVLAKQTELERDDFAARCAARPECERLRPGEVPAARMVAPIISGVLPDDAAPKAAARGDLLHDYGADARRAERDARHAAVAGVLEPGLKRTLESQRLPPAVATCSATTELMQSHECRTPPGVW